MFAFVEVQEGNSISPPYLEFAYEFVGLRKIQPRIDWTVACLYEKEEINTDTQQKKIIIIKKGLQPNRQIDFNRRPKCQFDIVLDIVMRSRMSDEIRTNLASDSNISSPVPSNSSATPPLSDSTLEINTTGLF